MAERTARAFAHLETLFAVRPEMTLLVLARDDWTAHSRDIPFRMPHWNRPELDAVARRWRG
jgi:hypothetical protein